MFFNFNFFIRSYFESVDHFRSEVKYFQPSQPLTRTVAQSNWKGDNMGTFLKFWLDFCTKTLQLTLNWPSTRNRSALKVSGSGNKSGLKWTAMKFPWTSVPAGKKWPSKWNPSTIVWINESVTGLNLKTSSIVELVKWHSEGTIFPCSSLHFWISAKTCSWTSWCSAIKAKNHRSVFDDVSEPAV